MQPLPAPTTWNFDPLVLLGLALLLGGYLAAIGPLRRARGEEPVARRRIVLFALGWLALALTLITPLDTLGRYYLFAAHTFQLFIITTVVAPLLMLALPEWLVTLLLPLRVLRDATRGLGFTLLCALAFNLIILVWHINPLYTNGLHNNALHDLASLSFLIAGVFTWWPVLTPMDRHTRMSNPFQMLYFVLESLPLDIFGIFAIFAPGPFYAVYTTAPRIFGLTPMTDQALAGAILAVPGNTIDIGLLSIVFFVWLARSEREQRARDRIRYAEEDAAFEAAQAMQIEATSAVDQSAG